jgi:hypothetical protein
MIKKNCPQPSPTIHAGCLATSTYVLWPASMQASFHKGMHAGSNTLPDPGALPRASSSRHRPQYSQHSLCREGALGRGHTARLGRHRALCREPKGILPGKMCRALASSRQRAFSKTKKNRSAGQRAHRPAALDPAGWPPPPPPPPAPPPAPPPGSTSTSTSTSARQHPHLHHRRPPPLAGTSTTTCTSTCTERGRVNPDPPPRREEAASGEGSTAAP